MALTKRVEILFDPEQYRLLEQLASARGDSVGALVRRAVEQVYLMSTLEKRKAAVDGILSEQSELTWEDAQVILSGDVGGQFEAS